MSTPAPTLSASALRAIAQSRQNYIVAGGIAAVTLVPMFALWAFMVLGYMGLGYRLKKSGTGDGSKAVQNLLPLRLQFINFTASVICMALEAQRRFTPIGSDHIIDTCMGATISMVLFYCMAKWSTYSFLMVKVYIASRGLNAAELKKKRNLLLVMSVLLAITCLAITSVSRGEMWRDTGMCLWILKGLWIAAFYPVGDLILSAYLIRAFIKPLRDTAKKSSNNELISYVIRENIQVGVVVIASSSIIHILVGVGAMAGILRLQLITEALICFDMLVNSIALFYSTRRSWVRAGAADSSVVDQRTQGRESIRGEAPLNRGKSGSVNTDMQLASPKSENSKTIPGTVTSDQGANFV